jgi:hypothetical protein
MSPPPQNLRQGYTQRCSDFTSSVWTGAELIVWGGTSGRRFNPATNSWADVTATGKPSSRQAQSAVWTGDSMVLYGGVGGGSNTGYIYR